MNSEPPAIRHIASKDTREFIDEICKDHQKGYRFTFFVGAGLSRPAGYPLPVHLGKRYLPYCIMRALGLDPLSKEPKRDRFQRWDTQSAGWPRMDEEIAERWSLEAGLSEELPHADELSVLLTRWLTNRAENPDGYKLQYPELSQSIVASALGAIQDWRSSLRFLCQLQMEGTELKLGRPDYAVQDSMFQALLQLCDPGLGHRMIAALCTVMRCSCIVTTNFDDLLEKAFAALPLALSTFEVAQPAPMPGATIVCSQRSLVKMNGGNYSLLANEILDAEPSKDDLDNFVGYLRGIGAQDNDALPAIIVSGVSGEEPRTLALFRHATERLPNLRIYWVAFSFDQGDADKLKNHLRFDVPRGEPNKNNRRLWRLAHTEHGLLLQQLFMLITRSLPSSGVVFPGLWRLPLPPIINRDDEIDAKFGVSISNAINASRMVLVLSSAPESAARRACAQVAGASRLSVSWLDLDQVGYPWGLLLRIVQMAARMHGTAEAPPALDFHQWQDKMKEPQRRRFIETMKHILRRYHVRLFDELVIYLNGLDELASHAPFGRESSGDLGEEYTAATLHHLWDCIYEIAKDRTCGIRFVIIGSTYARKKRADFADSSRNGTSLRDWFKKTKKKGKDVTIVSERQSPPSFVAKRIEEAEDWHGEDRLKIAYLYLVSSFRYSRHPVAISRIFGRFAERTKTITREYREAFTDSERWLREWLTAREGRPIVREKLGGLLWMHPRIKQELKPRIAQSWMKECGQDYPYEVLMLGNLLARHYGQLLLATADPLAGLELIHHVLRAIEASMVNCKVNTHTGTSVNLFAQLPPESRSELEALALHMVQHSVLAVKLCRPLLDRRLASDFAEASLDGLDEQIKRLRASLPSTVYKSLHKRLHVLELESAMARGNILLRSARSLEKWTKSVDSTLGMVEEPPGESLFGADATAVQFQARHESSQLMDRAKSRRLKEIGAWILMRQHDKARNTLIEVWLELAKRANSDCATQLSTPLIARLEGHLQPPGNLDDWEARAWLQHAWNADHPMTDAMMEHWRRYIVRACLWSTMLILNRAQSKHLAEGRHSGYEEWVRELGAAIWIANFGLEILRNADHSRDGVAVHEQVRLRCLIALCRAFRIVPSTDPDNRDYMEPVMRSLNGLRDATAWVEEFPFKDAELERAVIALRSAEVRLVALWNVEGVHALLSLIAQDDPNKIPFTKQQAERYKDEFMKLDIVGLRANAEQVLSLLDSAENTLRLYPKSVWWIWYLWTLKARISAFYFTLRAGDALSCEFPANVDVLMHVPNSLRTASRGGIFSAISMQGIRDPFRIARIIRSQQRVFAAEVFRSRLPQTRRSEKLKRVLEDGSSGMQTALDILKTQIASYCQARADNNLIRYCERIHAEASEFKTKLAIWVRSYEIDTPDR